MQSAQIYLDTIRECYEAFVIYSFFMYLLAYLEDEYGDISVYLSTKEEVPHMWGVQWVLKPWRMGDDFMWQSKKVRHCRPALFVVLLIQQWDSSACGSSSRSLHSCCLTPGRSGGGLPAAVHPSASQGCVQLHTSVEGESTVQGVLGYVILRPLMTGVGFIASLIGVYGDGELRFDRVYLYTTIVSNISQVWQHIRHALHSPAATRGECHDPRCHFCSRPSALCHSSL